MVTTVALWASLVLGLSTLYLAAWRHSARADMRRVAAALRAGRDDGMSGFSCSVLADRIEDIADWGRCE